MNEPSAKPPAVAFRYNGTDVLFDDNRMVSLSQMWEAQGKPANKEPAKWRKMKETVSFARHIASVLNMPEKHVFRSMRGRNSTGTFAHWQVALAYAKYLSHDFHRYVNQAFREWAEEKADPGLKADRAADALEALGRTREWAVQRLRGMGARKALTTTMAEHNCKVRGAADNPYAEATRSITLAVIGRTPREIKEEKGLPAEARTRDHLDEVQLAAIEFAEVLSRATIVKEAADGNEACVDCCRRAGKAVSLTLDALATPALRKDAS